MTIAPRYGGVPFLIAFTLALHARVASADEAADYARLVAENSNAYVTVKYVLKMESDSGNRESEAEITGVMIDPAGLVLCGNTRLGASRMMRQYGMTATPTEIKVLIGDDTEGLEAKVLARDSELDLAWVQVKDAKGRKFASLDLAHSAAPETGQRLLTIRRMAKYFDRAITVSEGRLSGRTLKPRDLLVPGGSMMLEPGLPVFTEKGDVIGVVVVQMPEEDELQAMAFSGIGRDIQSGLILPAAEVVKATQRAREGSLSEEEEPSKATSAKKGESKAAAKKNASGKAKPESKPSADEDEEEE